MSHVLCAPSGGGSFSHLSRGHRNASAAIVDSRRRYTSDGFGLKTADEAGKIFYESTAGDHLQFTSTQLLGWVEDYFL